MTILLSSKGKKNTGIHFPKQHTEVIPSQDHCYSSHPYLQLTLEKSECSLAVGAVQPWNGSPQTVLFSIFASFSWWQLPLSSLTNTFCCHTGTPGYSVLHSTQPIYSIIIVLGFSTSLSTVKVQCLPISRCFLRSCCSPLACHLKFYIFNLLKIFIAYTLGAWLLLLGEGVPTAHGILLHKNIFIQVCWAYPL